MGAWARGEANRHVIEGIDIEVKGNHAMDSVVKKGIAAELHHYPKQIVGTRIGELNTAAIEKYLASLNSFESVKCMVSSGGRLRIEIVPLVPVMRVFFGDNSYYINKNGQHIESKAEFYTHAPVVTGNFNSEFPPKSVLPLVNYIESDKTLREMVNMIEARDPNNLIMVPRILGHVVNFGDTTRLEEKAKALKLFYRKVMPYKGWEEYDTISLKFQGQIVATRRIKPRAPEVVTDVEETDPDEATLGDHLAETDFVKQTEE